MNDTVIEIRAIESKYGSMVFRFGVAHLIDVGIRNLNNNTVNERIEDIQYRAKVDESNEVHSFVNPEFHCEILRCALDLSKCCIWTLMRYAGQGY